MESSHIFVEFKKKKTFFFAINHADIENQFVNPYGVKKIYHSAGGQEMHTAMHFIMLQQIERNNVLPGGGDVKHEKRKMCVFEKGR
jgi:hypothetical protein